MAIKKHIPNFLTCLNLLFGCISIAYSTQGMLGIAAYLIFAAIILDFADGFAARALKAYSETGKQLDSLADMVSFGAAPAFILFYILDTQTVFLQNKLIAQGSVQNQLLFILPFTSFIIAVFSALRLAKFNIDPRQTENFIGLPTPATALFISSMVFIDGNSFFGEWFRNPYFLLIIIIFLSALMVSEISLFSLKMKNTKWNENSHRFIFILIAVILIAVLQFTAIPLVIMLYVVLSLLLPWNKVNKHEV